MVQTKLKMDKSVKQNTYSFNIVFRYTIPGIDTLIGNWVQGSRKNSGTTFMEV